MRILLALALVFVVTACSGTTAKQTTPQEIVAAIQAAGLTADNPRVMEPKDYGFAPALCRGMRIDLPSEVVFNVTMKHAAEVFVCDDAKEQATLKKWYDDLGKTSGMLAQYTYVKGPVLLVVDGQIGKEAADKYGAALP